MLTKEERETTINYNEHENLASIEVPVGVRLQKRLQKLGVIPVRQYTYRGTVASLVYEVPKGWIKINPGRKMSIEQRTKCADRARENFAYDFKHR